MTPKRRQCPVAILGLDVHDICAGYVSTQAVADQKILVYCFFSKRPSSCPSNLVGLGRSEGPAEEVTIEIYPVDVDLVPNLGIAGEQGRPVGVAVFPGLFGADDSMNEYHCGWRTGAVQLARDSSTSRTASPAFAVRRETAGVAAEPQSEG